MYSRPTWPGTPSASRKRLVGRIVTVATRLAASQASTASSNIIGGRCGSSAASGGMGVPILPAPPEHEADIAAPEGKGIAEHGDALAVGQPSADPDKAQR